MNRTLRNRTLISRGYRTAALLAGVTVSLGFGPAATAVQKVREGIQYFSSGNFAAAGQAFTEADVAEPGNRTIAFDRACAAAAAGEVARARDMFQDAALEREVGLAAQAHYNLGCLSAGQARTNLGDNPLDAGSEQRQQAMELLLTAVGHYRDCLRLDAGHSDARHNLELIRLFLKQIQAQWEQQDREKDRRELGLLEFLARIEQRQAALRSTVSRMGSEPESPRRRQLTRTTVDDQTALQEEIPPLKEKIETQLQAGAQGQPGSTAAQPGDSSQVEQARKLLLQLADEAGQRMLAAASRLEDSRFDEVDTEQRNALDRLNEIFMAVAPFNGILQRSLQQQEELTAASETLTASDENADDETADDQASVDQEAPANQHDVDDLLTGAAEKKISWQQSRVTQWSRMLSLKAQAELPGVEAQLKNTQTQSPQVEDTPGQPPKTGGATGSQPAAPDPAVQLQALNKALRTAVELAPQVEKHSAAAVAHLENSDVAAALPPQQAARKLLREIAEPLARDQQNQDQQNQDQQNQDQQNQDQQNQDQQNQDQQNQDQQGQDQNQNRQAGQSPQERAMSVLRRARERGRQHRDLQKQLQQMIGGRTRVDRDW